MDKKERKYTNLIMQVNCTDQKKKLQDSWIDFKKFYINIEIFQVSLRKKKNS